METFTATQHGEPFGTITHDNGTWAWDGQPTPFVAGRIIPLSALLANRVMHPARRAAYLTALGLPQDATRADELARTWGRRVTDAIEIVPSDGRCVPLAGAAHLPIGTAVTIGEGVATVGGARVGRLPRSIELFPPFTGTVIASTGAAAIIAR